MSARKPRGLGHDSEHKGTPQVLTDELVFGGGEPLGGFGGIDDAEFMPPRGNFRSADALTGPLQRSLDTDSFSAPAFGFGPSFKSVELPVQQQWHGLQGGHDLMGMGGKYGGAKELPALVDKLDDFAIGGGAEIPMHYDKFHSFATETATHNVMEAFRSAVVTSGLAELDPDDPTEDLSCTLTGVAFDATDRVTQARFGVTVFAHDPTRTKARMVEIRRLAGDYMAFSNFYVRLLNAVQEDVEGVDTAPRPHSTFGMEMALDEDVPGPTEAQVRESVDALASMASSTFADVSCEGGRGLARMVARSSVQAPLVAAVESVPPAVCTLLKSPIAEGERLGALLVSLLASTCGACPWMLDSRVHDRLRDLSKTAHLQETRKQCASALAVLDREL